MHETRQSICDDAKTMAYARAYSDLTKRYIDAMLADPTAAVPTPSSSTCREARIVDVVVSQLDAGTSQCERLAREAIAILGACAAGRIGTLTHLRAKALVAELASEYAGGEVDFMDFGDCA